MHFLIASVLGKVKVCGANVRNGKTNIKDPVIKYASHIELMHYKSFKYVRKHIL